MLFSRASLALVLSSTLIAIPAFATRTHRQTGGHAQGSRKLTHKASKKLHGQQAIAPERVTEIQQALIREHYLSGDATGKWDSTTETAMRKFQSDQGWQTKLMPDSRALKKLGLGPDYSSAINAKDATFSDPPPVSTIPTDQANGFAAAAKINK
jgi:peptidoglycan hydrolase-like protein with peptidoglycan-binding domain